MPKLHKIQTKIPVSWCCHMVEVKMHTTEWMRSQMPSNSEILWFCYYLKFCPSVMSWVEQCLSQKISLYPQTCEYGHTWKKRLLCICNWVKHLKLSYPVVPNPMTSFLIRDRHRGETQTVEGCSPWQRLICGRFKPRKPRISGSHWKGQGLALSGLSVDTSPANTLITDFRPPGLWETKSLLF
jgi:hypothetical protein